MHDGTSEFLLTCVDGKPSKFHKGSLEILVLKISGGKVAIFDTTPKGFISLIPSFWSVHTRKVAVFMHHDFALVEQVFFHQV